MSSLLLLLLTLYFLSTPVQLAPTPNDCTPTLYVGTSDALHSGLVTSTDFGKTWKDISPPQSPTSPNEIYSLFASGDHIFVATPSGLQISQNHGLNYTLSAMVNSTAVNVEDKNVIAGTYDRSMGCFPSIPETPGQLELSQDGGKTFTKQIYTGSLCGPVTGVYQLHGRVFVTVSSSQGGIGVTNDLIRWNQFTNNSGLGSSSATCIAGEGKNVFVGLDGVGGLIAVSQDSGDTFVPVQTMQSGNFGVSSIYASGARVYVGTNGGGIAISNSAFSVWTLKTIADGLASNKTMAIAAVGDTIIVGTPVGLSISNDAGQTWQTKTTVDGLLQNQVTAVFGDCV